MSLNGTSGDQSTYDPVGQPVVKAKYPSAVERVRRFARFSKLPRNRNAWIVVNTNTFHICNNRDAFATYASTKPFVVKTVGGTDNAEELGLNNTYTSVGIGQVWLRHETLDGRPEQCYLQDVLYIPDAFANVVCLPRMIKGELAYKLDTRRGIAFSTVDDRDLAWFPPDSQGLFCLALKGETPYFPGPSSIYRGAPVRSLWVHTVGLPLPFVINRFDKLKLVAQIIHSLEPGDEESRNFYGSQKTEFSVAQVLELLNMQKERAWNEAETVALSCPGEQCYFRGAFVLRQYGDFAICKDRDLFHTFTSIPPQPAMKGSAEVMGIGDLYLDILFSNGSTGKLFIGGALYAPKNLVNQITYRCLFDPKMVCEGGSFDPTTGITTDKDGGEVAWFTKCHKDGTFCLRQPDVRFQERKSATPRVPPGLPPPGLVPPGLASPEKPTSSKATKVVNGKEISPARERAPAVSSGGNNKVTFLTADGSVGQIGAPRNNVTTPLRNGPHSTDSPPESGAGTSGKKMSCQVEVPGNDEPAQQVDQAAFVFRNLAGDYRPTAEMTSKKCNMNEEVARRKAIKPDLGFESQPSTLQTALAYQTPRQAEVPEKDEDAKQTDQKASTSKGTVSQESTAVEATGKENTYSGASLTKAATKGQTFIAELRRSQAAANSRMPPNEAEIFDKANNALSALVAGLAKEQPDLELGLPANPRLPPLPPRTDPLFPFISRAIRDFHSLTYCFTTIAASGKLTEMQRNSYFSALSKIALLSNHGGAGLAKLVMYDVDSTPLAPPSLDTSPTPPPPASPQTSRAPPPTCEELQFHDSPRALVERILLHGDAATRAIAEASAINDARAWQLTTIVGGLAGPKLGSQISRHYETVVKRKSGEISTEMPQHDDKNGTDGAAAAAPGAVLKSNHEKEVLSLKRKEAIEDMAHQKLGYAVEMDWGGTGTGDRKTKLDHAAKKGEGAAVDGKTVTERAVPKEKPTENDIRRGKSAQDRPFAKDILQAAKEPFIAGLLKLNEQNLALRKKHAVQKDATKEEPAECKDQDTMAALCKVGQQNLAVQLERMALKQENERLLDLGRNTVAQMSQEIQDEESKQKNNAIAGVMKLNQKQDLTPEEQKALLGDEKVRILLDLAARCQQEALATLGQNAGDGKREIEEEKGNETKEEQTVKTSHAAAEQAAEHKTPNDMKATERVPNIATLKLRPQSPTAGEKAATGKENQCSLDSLLQKRNEEEKEMEKGESG